MHILFTHPKPALTLVFAVCQQLWIEKDVGKKRAIDDQRHVDMGLTNHLFATGEIIQSFLNGNFTQDFNLSSVVQGAFVNTI